MIIKKLLNALWYVKSRIWNWLQIKKLHYKFRDIDNYRPSMFTQINPWYRKNNASLNKFPLIRPLGFYFYTDYASDKYCPLHGCDISGLKSCSMCEREIMSFSALRYAERRICNWLHRGD